MSQREGEGDTERMLPKAEPPTHGYCRCRHTTFQRIHEVCKVLFSMALSFGFIMFLATQENGPVVVALLLGGFVFFVWMITLSIGAALYGCDTLWTGLVYTPPGKSHD